jgi:hypothetical protein
MGRKHEKIVKAVKSEIIEKLYKRKFFDESTADYLARHYKEKYPAIPFKKRGSNNEYWVEVQVRKYGYAIFTTLNELEVFCDGYELGAKNV